MDKKLNDILPFVEKPSRYIGQEFGLDKIKKPKNPKLKICIVFPDLYEIGMSYLGIKILYYLLQNISDVLVDVAFMPKEDLAQYIRDGQLKLSSLEYSIPLKEFDVIGFSLSYELCYTNVLEMLDLAGLPILSGSRDENHPLIIAGGGCVSNPEPMHKFIDAFILGDGEETLVDIVSTLIKIRDKNRVYKVEKISKIEGVYIPSFYDVEYDGIKIKSINPKKKGLKKIKRRIVKDLDKSYYPKTLFVPNVDVVHNNFSVEIQRGCIRGCKFCHAGYVNKPVRIRSLKKIKELITKGVKTTGYRNVSLLSLSVVDYPFIEDLLRWFLKKYYKSRVSVSLPSLRCDNFSIAIADLVSKNKKSSLTFAPEAGTQRLRDFIAKDITEEDVFQCIEGAFTKGWKLVKLYFMYGLPTETHEDLEGIIDLVKRLKSSFKGLNFNVSISAYVPKAHTPFQWVAQDKLDVLMEKKFFLLDGLRKYCKVKHSKIEASIVEGLLSRGDRRIADVVENAWKNGASFDQWDEKFKFEFWQKACENQDIDIDKYISREIESKDVLPWSHLNFGMSEAYLYKKYLEQKPKTGIVLKMKNKKSFVMPKAHELPDNRFRYRVTYAKEESLKFLSHLEITSCLKQSLRRADLPIFYSMGFNPLPKVSFAYPLAVGFKGENELFELDTIEKLKIIDVRKRLKEVLPKGVKLKKVEIVTQMTKSLAKIIKRSRYVITGKKGFLWEKDILKALKNKDEFFIEVQGKKKKRAFDVKLVVHKLKIIDNNILDIIINNDIYNGSIKKIVTQLFNIDEDTFKSFSVTRKGFELINKN